MLEHFQTRELLAQALSRLVPHNTVVDIGPWEIHRSTDGGEISVCDQRRVTQATYRVDPQVAPAEARALPHGDRQRST